MTPLRWGLLGTGKIARTFARGVARSRSGRVVAVGSRTREAAEMFARELDVPRAHGSYEALLADSEIEAVYVSTPHPHHAEWAIKAAEAGKHVLCEKPLGMNRAEGEAMFAPARRHGVVLMEAFMYRCHPQTAKIVEIVRSGRLGDVGLVQASFGFRAEFDPGSRLWSKELGGGGILDVGCYPVSMARLVAGAVSGRAFLEPDSVHGAGVLHAQSGIDVYAAATLGFANGVVAQVAAGVGLAMENVVRIHGSKGWLFVPVPWVIAPEGGVSRMVLHRADAAPEEITCEAGPLYAIEADTFAEAVRAGRAEVAAMSRGDSLGNLAVLDRWRAAIGLRYAGDATD